MISYRSFAYIAVVGGSISCGTFQARPPQPAEAEQLAAGIATADSLIEGAVGKLVPGAVLLVSTDGRVVHERAFGFAQLNDYEGHRLASPPAMRTSTMFDLASVTKVMATTMATMLLVDRGKIELDAPVWRYLPDFRGAHLDSITVRHLLSHSAGLVQWQPLYYHASNTAQTYGVIRDMPLQWGVGDARHYSDLGFMLLGDVIERVSGQRLDAFLEQNLYRPLGLRSTTFNPKGHGFTEFAATEQGNVYEKHMVYDSTFGYRYRGDPTAWNGWRQYVLNGEVDDGNSYYANDGVAGHAGLFSTAADLRVLVDLVNNRGSYGGRQYIRPEVIDAFLTRDKYQNYLGWQAPSYLPAGSFSHTGFTGTYVAGIPQHKLSIVLLTNRQNMGTDAKGYFPDVGPLQQAVARAIAGRADTPGGGVWPRGHFAAGPHSPRISGKYAPHQQLGPGRRVGRDIVGGHLKAGNIALLERLARSENLWERRIAIVSTFHFIKRNEFRPTLKIATLLLGDSHDLIHKATGWMLREVGKRDRTALDRFLKKHYRRMPRTMLRYAIERHPERIRKQYLAGTI